jgi:hypothetical protein
MVHNVMSNPLASQDISDVRGKEIVDQLQAFAETAGQNNWSIFEMFTLAIKTFEMGIEHARNNRVAHPKRLGITMTDGTEIEVTVKQPKSAAQKEMENRAIIMSQLDQAKKDLPN